MPDNAKKQPKKQVFSLQGFDQASYKQTEAYVQAIDVLYNQAVQEFTGLAGKVNLNPNKPFSFADYPATQTKAQQIVNALAAKMQAVVKKGSRDQWLYACKKNDAFLNHIMNTSKVPKKLLAKYQSKNLEALDTFQNRKLNGMDLSKRIWNYAGQMKTQMELGIDIALCEGKSAASLSRDLRQYLTDPDKLFHKVKDKHGMLHISKNAAAFHPGQGKYRSSYKNAMRLTRSEINMAYRVSDQLRWQNLDFVVGFEVKLSNNHTTLINGVPTPFVDICNDLAGRYPKSFLFKGWHPQCRCHVVPIMKSDQEMNDQQFENLRAAWKGDNRKQFQSKNQVNDVPDNFKQWIADNMEKSQAWASPPYFVKDNFKGGNLSGGLSLIKPTIAPPAAQNKAVAPLQPTITTQPKVQPIPKATPTPKPTPVLPTAKMVKPVFDTISKDLILVEDQIRLNKQFETAVAIDKNGNKIIDKRGQATSVSFTNQEIASIKDTIFTHNHPRGWAERDGTLKRLGNSFSPNDIIVAVRGNVAEIRAVTAHYTFSMKRPKNGWMTDQQVITRFKKVEAEVFAEMRGLIGNSSYSHQDIAVNRAEALHYHMVWKRFCKKYKIEYTKAKTRD